MPTELLVDPQTAVRAEVKKLSTIATLPEVTVKIVATVEDARSSAAQLHRIVAHDPALVTRILKVVNSAFYGLPGQIGSVERAIVLLGLNAVKNLAVAASLGQLFRGVKLGAGYTAKDLWTHCVAVAVTARELARQMKLPIAEEAFLSGMIHDLGLLVSLQLHAEPFVQVCQEAKEKGGDGGGQSPDGFCEIERRIIGADHTMYGQALAEQWKFPRTCQLVAGYHHRPTALANDTRLLVTLVHVADTLCCQKHQGFDLTALHQSLDAAGLGEVQIDPVLIEQTAAKIEGLVTTAAGVFG